MAILKSEDLERTLARNALPGARCILLYGPESGLARELADGIAAAFSKASRAAAEVITLDEAELAETPDRPAVELLTPSMFGDPKIVRAVASTKLKIDIVETILDARALDGLFIVLAGELKKDAKLRKLFESAPSGLAVACYPDDASSVAQLIDDVLAAHDLSIDDDAHRLLVDLLGADRRVSRGEVEKLALYARGQTTISAQNVAEVVGDASDSGLDDIVFAACSGDGPRAIQQYDRLVASGTAEQSILLAVERHLIRLHGMALKVEGGQSIDSVLQSTRPPIFFKSKATFKRQLALWSRTGLTAALKRCAQTVRTCRTATPLEAAAVPQMLLAIAAMAGRRQRRM